jgi:hypothetical protein
MLTKEMIFDVDMLDAGMHKRVFRKSLGCSVVTGNCSRGGLAVPNSIK